MHDAQHPLNLRLKLHLSKSVLFSSACCVLVSWTYVLWPAQVYGWYMPYLPSVTEWSGKLLSVLLSFFHNTNRLKSLALGDMACCAVAWTPPAILAISCPSSLSKPRRWVTGLGCLLHIVHTASMNVCTQKILLHPEYVGKWRYEHIGISSARGMGCGGGMEHWGIENWKYSCSLPNFWESPPYVNVPCPMWMFPALCECSPSSVGIPRGACSSFETGPNSMILVSIEREKSDLQYYVIRIWIDSLLACVYSKWSIF